MSTRVIVFLVIVAFLVTVRRILFSEMDKDGHFPLFNGAFSGYKILYRKIKELKKKNTSKSEENKDDDDQGTT